MKNIILRWVAGLFAVLITIWAARQIPPVKLMWEPAWGVVIFVPVMALVNAVIRPVVKLLCMPINCMTLGLFSLVVSALLFWGALFGSVVYAATSTILSWAIKEKPA